MPLKVPPLKLMLGEVKLTFPLKTHLVGAELLFATNMVELVGAPLIVLFEDYWFD